MSVTAYAASPALPKIARMHALLFDGLDKMSWCEVSVTVVISPTDADGAAFAQEPKCPKCRIFNQLGGVKR